MIKRIFIILLTIFIYTEAYADLIIENIITSNDASLREINRQSSLSRGLIIRSKSEKEVRDEALKQIEKIRIKYEKLNNETIAKSIKIAEQRNFLEKEKESLEREKKKLSIEIKNLEKEKITLKKSKELYSTGLYASLGAILLGLLGLIGFLSRRPLIKLEVKLKELEIKEKEELLKNIK